MKNTMGNSVALTVFGESHGTAIGAVLDGIAPGIPVDTDFIASQLVLRRPVGSISTPRSEEDKFIIESGVFEGKTTGTPICIVIPNEDTRSKDYGEIRSKARPGHADFTAFAKYHGFEDYRGGGHFSGRITAGIVAAGAIAISALKQKGILIGTHIAKCAGISDREFKDFPADIKALSEKSFAVLDGACEEPMKNAIIAAKTEGDSVGGVLETAVIGLPEGIGEPWFDTVEGLLSHALFSIPAIKGVEFGGGFALSDMRGSEANDEFYLEDGRVQTSTNNNGGINGGITNGMPLIFRCGVKPTPTIGKTQNTVDFIAMQNTELSARGRHDPCIVHRARVVVDSITALVLCDILAGRFGTDWLVK
ncbi:MAG: chorismate synthase [Clostridia bacterium]|nr:chorismate synthase [Clostridia bacterium]